MYSPDAFKITDEDIIEEFICNHPFVILTSEQNRKIEVTHLPINRFSDGELYGHVAKENIHSKLTNEQEICLIFTGEHAYISPTYYKSSFNVPTWNYSTVHIYGNIEYIENPEKTWQLLEELTSIHEGDNGWILPQEERYKELVNYLTFFRVKVTHIEAKFKFNQNKSEEDIRSIIQVLKNNGQIQTSNFMQELSVKNQPFNKEKL